MKREFQSKISEVRVRQMIKVLREMKREAKLVHGEFDRLLSEIDNGEVYRQSKWIKLLGGVIDEAAELDDYFQMDEKSASEMRHKFKNL